jgi:hypothetical protein
MRGLRRQNVQLREERGEGVLGLSDVLPDDARQVDKTEMRAHAVGGLQPSSNSYSRLNRRPSVIALYSLRPGDYP